MDDLGKITGAGNSVTVRGHTVVVREVTMDGLRDFVAACAPFLHAFDEAGELAAAKGSPDHFALFKLLADQSPAFIRAAEVVTNVDRTFLGRLRPDEFFQIAAKIVEVNGDFFVQRLAPSLVKMVQGIQLVGTMLGNDSSPQGIATPISTSTAGAYSTGS